MPRTLSIPQLADDLAGGGLTYIPGSAGEPTPLLDLWAADPDRTRGARILTSLVPGINGLAMDALHPTATVTGLFMQLAWRTCPCRTGPAAARWGRRWSSRRWCRRAAGARWRWSTRCCRRCPARRRSITPGSMRWRRWRSRRAAMPWARRTGWRWPSLATSRATSTTAALALGDALAVCLLEARHFSAQDFARLHPGGTLGKQLYLTVGDLSRQNQRPHVGLDAPLKDVLIEISGKRLGATAVLDAAGALAGIITDGDLRRVLAADVDLRSAKIADLMKRNPCTIDADRLAAEAVKQMETLRINSMLVVDNDNRLVGAFNMHDLFRAGVL